MTRTLLLVAFGLAVGTSVTYLVVHGSRATVVPSLGLAATGAGDSASASHGTTAASLSDGAGRPRTFRDLLQGRIGVAERAALYELALRSDARALRALLQEAAAMPPSEGRGLALEALLTRYAELDPRAAVAAVGEYGLGTDLLAAVYATWASRDASDALDALRDIESPTVAEAIGTAMLPVLGNDDLAIARIAGSASSIDADKLRIEVLAARAEADPAAALDDALTLPRSLQPAAFDRIAAVWARRDAAAALRRAAELPTGPRTELRGAVLRSWARLDPDAALAYVRDLDSVEQQQLLLQGGGLAIFGLVEPEKALGLARELRGDAGRMAQTFALQSWAATDPLGALAHVEELAPGPDRDQLMSAIAAGYARLDPEAALAWAQSLQSPPVNVLFAVLSAVARTDPDRALDLALSMSSSPGQSGGLPPMLVAAQILANASDPEKVADRVLAVPDRAIREQTLAAIANRWSATDPDAALRWLIANGENVPTASLLRAGQQLARTNPAAAAGYMNQIPNELRAAWLGSVAAGYAQSDPDAAMSWVAQYQGQAGYEGAVAAIVQRAADYEPALAAHLLESVDASAPEYFAAVSSIALRWGRQSPRDAAQWAAGLHDGAPRSSALSTILQQWSSSDPAAARAWVLGMPEGDARDAALLPVIVAAAASSETVDPVLVDAFNTDGMRRQALIQAVAVLAQRDRDAARRFANQFSNDPQLQAQAQQIIESAGNSRGGVRMASEFVNGFSAVAPTFRSFSTGTILVDPLTASPPGQVIRVAPVMPLPVAIDAPVPAFALPAPAVPR